MTPLAPFIKPIETVFTSYSWFCVSITGASKAICIESLKFLKSLAGFYIINSENSVKRYDNEQTLIHELVAAVLKGAPNTLESFFLQDWQRATTDAAMLRVVIDQVASLTDPGAIALAARLR
jgi:dGTPase